MNINDKCTRINDLKKIIEREFIVGDAKYKLKLNDSNSERTRRGEYLYKQFLEKMPKGFKNYDKYQKELEEIKTNVEKLAEGAKKSFKTTAEGAKKAVKNLKDINEKRKISKKTEKFDKIKNKTSTKIVLPVGYSKKVDGELTIAYKNLEQQGGSSEEVKQEGKEKVDNKIDEEEELEKRLDGVKITIQGKCTTTMLRKENKVKNTYIMEEVPKCLIKINDNEKENEEILKEINKEINKNNKDMSLEEVYKQKESLKEDDNKNKILTLNSIFTKDIKEKIQENIFKKYNKNITITFNELYQLNKGQSGGQQNTPVQPVSPQAQQGRTQAQPENAPAQPGSQQTQSGNKQAKQGITSAQSESAGNKQAKQGNKQSQSENISVQQGRTPAQSGNVTPQPNRFLVNPVKSDYHILNNNGHEIRFDKIIINDKYNNEKNKILRTYKIYLYKPENFTKYLEEKINKDLREKYNIIIYELEYKKYINLTEENIIKTDGKDKDTKQKLFNDIKNNMTGDDKDIFYKNLTEKVDSEYKKIMSKEKVKENAAKVASAPKKAAIATGKAIGKVTKKASEGLQHIHLPGITPRTPTKPQKGGAVETKQVETKQTNLFYILSVFLFGLVNIGKIIEKFL